ncbi:MAG: radical SAM protein [Candidatus Woesearchaeota archaeon]
MSSYELLKNCNLCPRECGVNRLNETGFCKTGYFPKISSIYISSSEEPVLCNEIGAGLIYFSGCPMDCIYCHMSGFSRTGKGKEITLDELVDSMLKIQEKGAKTLLFLSATQYLPWVLDAIDYAKRKGFSLPIVYKTSGYEKVEVLRMMKGYVDIYLPDLRYTSNEIGEKYSHVPNYWDITREAIIEMYDQVGYFDENKMKGLIVRILLLPHDLNGTERAFKFIKELDEKIPISIMTQYTPLFEARNDDLISRRINRDEIFNVFLLAIKYNIKGWMQGENLTLEEARKRIIPIR